MHVLFDLIALVQMNEVYFKPGNNYVDAYADIVRYRADRDRTTPKANALYASELSQEMSEKVYQKTFHSPREDAFMINPRRLRNAKLMLRIYKGRETWTNR
jgi:hypothetical protein